jgi:energy-converting hydrogenase Eha subunit C
MGLTLRSCARLHGPDQLRHTANSSPTGSFDGPMTMAMDPLQKVSFTLCLGAGIVCALFSAYFFVFASYDSAIPAIVLLGFALAFETVAAIISRNNAAKPGNGRPSS